MNAMSCLSSKINLTVKHPGIQRNNTLKKYRLMDTESLAFAQNELRVY